MITTNESIFEVFNESPENFIMNKVKSVLNFVARYKPSTSDTREKTFLRKPFESPIRAGIAMTITIIISSLFIVLIKKNPH